MTNFKRTTRIYFLFALLPPHRRGLLKKIPHPRTEGLDLSQGQRAKKVVFDSPGLVDFAIGLVNSVFNLPNGQVVFFEEFE